MRQIEAISPEGDRTLELSAMLAANGDSVTWRSTLERLNDAQDITRRATAWNVSVFGGRIHRGLEAAGAMTAADRAPEVRATGHLVQAAYALALGRVGDAGASVRRVAELDPGLALAYGAAFDLLPFRSPGAAALEARRRELLAWAPADGCVSPHPVRTYQPLTCARPVVRLYLLGLIEAQLGMATEAEARVAALEERIVQGDRPRQVRGFIAEIEAELAWLDGNAEGAVAAFEADPGHIWYMEALQSLFHSHDRGRFRRAQALERACRLADAARWYGSFGEEGDLDLVYLAPGMVGRGRVLEALGRPAEATEAFRRAADLLTDPEGAWVQLAEEAREGVG